MNDESIIRNIKELKYYMQFISYENIDILKSYRQLDKLVKHIESGDTDKYLKKGDKI